MKEAVGQTLRFVKRFGIMHGLRNYLLLQKSKGLISVALEDYQHPLLIRPDTSDRLVFYQVCVMNEYEFDYEVHPAFIVDAGGNVGYTAAYFANRYPQAKIITIEPEEENFKMLVANTKLYLNVVPLQAGLWPEAKKLNVTNTNSSSWAFTLEESKEDIPNALDAITLDGLLTRYGQQYIDILKIDIEGAEKELFSTNYQTWLPRTKVIVIELHDRMRRGCSKAFFKALINYDFRVQLKGENLVCINDALI